MKKVLLVFPHFYPGYKAGGPIRSATNLVKLLVDSFTFKVYTSDRDLGDPEPYVNVNVNSWSNSFFGVPVFYSSSSLKNLKYSLEHELLDVLYLNSFFNFNFSIKFLLAYLLGWIKCSRIVLAPRGELTKGAMSLKSWKKKIYLIFFKSLGFHKKITFHFTSEDELKESLMFLGDVKYIVAPNMHGVYPPYQIKNKDVGSLKIIFLSRISPKKNLLLAIRTLQHISNGQVEFTIAGAIDDQDYWEKCQHEISSLPNNVVVKFLGPVKHELVKELLNDNHVFILPTLNENYGHAIVEAMVHSNLVLLSDQTPWNQVGVHGSYIVTGNDITQYAKLIDEMICFDSYQFNAKTRSTYYFADAVLEKNKHLIKDVFDLNGV